jgi:hypothetical protein
MLYKILILHHMENVIPSDPQIFVMKNVKLMKYVDPMVKLTAVNI